MAALPYMSAQDKRRFVLLAEARQRARDKQGPDISAADAARLFQMVEQLAKVAKRSV